MILTGQIIGFIAALFGFLSYQCKDQKKLIAVQSLSTLSLCISYMFLGAWSGTLMNIICLIRNFIIYRKDIKIFSYSFWPYLLAAIMAFTGALSWQGYMSLFIIIPLAINTIFIYFPNVQNLRKSILLTSTMVLIYNIHYVVLGGIINESMAIISSIIALYRYRKK